MKLSLTPLLILLFIAFKSFSQQTKEVVEESGDKYNRVELKYSVLKDNPSIKHGPYKFYSGGKLAISGFYKMDKKDSVWYRYNSKGAIVSKKLYADNKRAGTWEFYNQQKEIAWQYDVSKDSIINNQEKSFEYAYAYQSANGEWIKDKADSDPVWLRSNYEWQSFLNRTLRYPQDAIDNNAMGSPSVEITLDENGNVIDYSIGLNVYPALNDEAMRVVKLFEPEFLPAVKDGKKVKSKVRIPIVFRIER